jgi:hypothetical protein
VIRHIADRAPLGAAQTVYFADSCQLERAWSE